MPHCAAFAGPSGPAFFFFCLSPVSLNRLSPSGDALVSSHLGLATAPGFAHNWVTHLQQGWSGAWVVLLSLPRPLTGHESSHRGESCFPPRTNSPLPLKGEGRDFAHLWGFGFSLAVAFGNRWPQLAHTGPTRRVCCFSGVVPLPGSHNRTQGRTGPNLVSPSFLGVLLLRKSR